MQRNEKYGVSVALETRQHGVLVVRIVGLLTAESLLAVKAKVVRDCDVTEISAFAVDYSRSIVAMDGAGLDRVLEGEEHDAAPSLPAAMIVNPALLDMFDGHALRMAERGVVRAAFTEGAPALAWAARHALRRRMRTAADRPEAQLAIQHRPPASPADAAPA